MVGAVQLIPSANGMRWLPSGVSQPLSPGVAGKMQRSPQVRQYVSASLFAAQSEHCELRVAIRSRRRTSCVWLGSRACARARKAARRPDIAPAPRHPLYSDLSSPQDKRRYGVSFRRPECSTMTESPISLANKSKGLEDSISRSTFRNPTGLAFTVLA